jgi:hypothetical protein
MKMRAVVPISAVLLSLMACSGTTTLPPDTVGPVPLVSEPATLLPVLDDTLPGDITVPLAPDTLFGGDLCTALTESDFSATSIGGSGKGKLTAATSLGEDACSYEVHVGSNDIVVVVRATTADDFDHPVTTAQEIDKFSNLGEEAIGVARGNDSYEVIVRASTGYFSVTTPDKASARALAAAAVKRVLQG